jgi:hypothetical protein
MQNVVFQISPKNRNGTKANVTGSVFMENLYRPNVVVKLRHWSLASTLLILSLLILSDLGPGLENIQRYSLGNKRP